MTRMRTARKRESRKMREILCMGASPGYAARMLSHLCLRDFRPFASLDWQPRPDVNFILAPNATGKTSLLEAICFLLRLQSPRTSLPGECVRFGCPGFSVDGQWNDHRLRVKYEQRLKRFSLDSQPQSSATEYLAVARVTWISNDDLDLVRSGGSARRRFLDFLGAQAVPGYLRQLRAYERAVRARNSLLRDARPHREVAAFDGPLAAAGDFLIEVRAQMTAALEPCAAGFCRQISGTAERLSIAYRPGAPRPMAEALEAAREDDARLRMTTLGPHRDDLKLLLDEKPAGTFASEGQQRSIALALKAAQASELSAQTGSHPLYLMDDIFGELDAPRRNRLLEALPAAAQKIIATTSLDWLAGREPVGTVFHLHTDGSLTHG